MFTVVFDSGGLSTVAVPHGIVSFVELSVSKIVNVKSLTLLPVFPLTSLAVTLTRQSLELMSGTLREYLPLSGLFEAMGFQDVPESFEKVFPNYFVPSGTPGYDSSAGSQGALRIFMVSFTMLFPDIFIVLGCEIITVLLINYSQGRIYLSAACRL